MLVAACAGPHCWGFGRREYTTWDVMRYMYFMGTGVLQLLGSVIQVHMGVVSCSPLLGAKDPYAGSL